MKMLKNKAFWTFWTGLIFYILVILPELIKFDGILLYTGDYSMQSVPFTYHIRASILSGETNWDRYLGLGSSFLESFAFYNLFSPFTLPYLLVPESAVIYAMPYINALKYGCGSLFAFLYIKRFLKNEHFAVLGGMLYMFSSFSSYNLIFHFTDVIAMFPLLLISMEELCVHKRRCVFALSVAVMALTNYYFFFGEAIFCVVYYFMRTTDKEFGRGWKHFLSVLLEAVIGTAAAGIVIFPLAMRMLSYEKSMTLLGLSDMFVYRSIFDYLKIIQSMFMVPDPFSFVSLFPSSSTIYPYGTLGASVAMYVPMFSAAGVISFIAAYRKSWQTRLTLACLVMAFVPVLNQLFSALNHGYYARWLYMPMLIFVLMTVKALDEQVSFKPGLISCAAVTALLFVWFLVFDTEEYVALRGLRATLSKPLTVIHFAITAVSIMLTLIVVKTKRDKEFIPKLYIISAVGIYMCYGIMTFYQFMVVPDMDTLISSFNFNEPLPQSVNNEERLSASEGLNNINLIHRIPETNNFNSVFDSGYEEFINDNGMVASSKLNRNITPSETELADLCSAKYFYAGLSALSEINRDLDPIPYGDDYFIAENPYYIPMGFAYDRMITAEDFTEITDRKDKYRMYMKALVCDDPSLFSGILELYDPDGLEHISDEEYLRLVEERRAVSSYSVENDTDGLTVRIAVPKKTVVFFSVSNNEHWKAYIDDAETEIYRVNNGLTGVITPEGDHEIRLKYNNKNITTGFIISCIGAAGIAALALSSFLAKKKQSVASENADNTEI